MELQRPWANNIDTEEKILVEELNKIPIILILIWATLLRAINFFISLHSIILKHTYINPRMDQIQINEVTLNLTLNREYIISKP